MAWFLIEVPPHAEPETVRDTGDGELTEALMAWWHRHHADNTTAYRPGMVLDPDHTPSMVARRQAAAITRALRSGEDPSPILGDFVWRMRVTRLDQRGFATTSAGQTRIYASERGTEQLIRWQRRAGRSFEDDLGDVGWWVVGPKGGERGRWPVRGLKPRSA